MSRSVEPTITLTERDEYWVAIHQPTNVAAQAETRDQALNELDDAVALHTNDATEPLDNEGEILREIGLDPDEIAEAREADKELPEFMR